MYKYMHFNGRMKTADRIDGIDVIISTLPVTCYCITLNDTKQDQTCFTPVLSALHPDGMVS